MAKSSTLRTTLYVLGMLLFGSLNTITMKVQFTMQSTGAYGDQEKFEKPWFSTWVMFAGMTSVLAAEALSVLYRRSKTAKTVPLMADVTDPSNGVNEPAEAEYSWGKKVVMVAIPSIFDLAATGLCSMGMIYIPASVWQMLRGAEIVFAALLSVAALGRHMYAFNWLGIFMCVVGVTFVGFANVWGGGAAPAKGDDEQDTGMLLFGMLLVVFGQVVQAAQVIAEEWLLKDVDLPEMQIIGFEGMWGLLAMSAVIYPILYMMPGHDHGHFEDPFDTAAMIQNSGPLAKMVLLNLFSCATYNVTGIAVTGALTAVHRAMLEASRTMVIWAFGLYVHYAVNAESGFGEAWTPYSGLQLLGFVIIMCGQAIYGEIGCFKLPGFYYPPPGPADMATKFASPSAHLKMSSPLPRTHPGMAFGAASPSPNP